MAKPKSSTISHDPYAFIPAPVESPRAVPEQPGKKPALEMEKITIPFPVALAERVRNAAYWDRLTLAGLVTEAVQEALDRMEQERGEPYPPRASELKGGRPVGRRNVRNA
jgi:hypothetical protein